MTRIALSYADKVMGDGVTSENRVTPRDTDSCECLCVMGEENCLPTSWHDDTAKFLQRSPVQLPVCSPSSASAQHTKLGLVA